ncbi:MAG TPA: hypothetical protein VG847_07055 [Chitinophagaceae bacterium]|nr:hypothetical protein [Chitinophagaceae bacterium]
MKAKLTVITVIIICSFYLSGKAQVSVSYIEPTSEGGNDGSITIHGLSKNKTYIAFFKKDGEQTRRENIKTGMGTDGTIKNLEPGVYNNIYFTEGNGITSVPDIISLGKVAVQSTRFFGAIYNNFTGVADDDPTDFTQYYAMLSQPLRKVYGIDSYSKSNQRFVLLRNLFFQLTYGNTDKFKLYSFDTLNSKYVNRLDLFAHSYLDAKGSLNLLTYIFPEKKGFGDLAHLYLNATVGFLSTEVTDSTRKDSSNNPIARPVHSMTMGWDAAVKFQRIFNSSFQVEVGFKMFWVYALSAAFNPQLNPQAVNVTDIGGAQNQNKMLERKTNFPFYNLDILISYGLASDPTSNTSNIFLHYSSTSNMAKVFGKNYTNDYFQFQLGVALDITKIFSKSK